MNQSHKPPSIVVGIDGSKPAVQAALWAVDEAASRDIPLRLLYAIEPDDPGYAAHGAAARKLAAAENAVRYAFTAVEAADRPVKVEVEITQERPVTSLIRASAAAALVCVGAIGVHHFRPERVGSTAAALALSAQCPVAIVRPHRVPIGRDAAWIVVEADGSSDIGVLLGAVMAEARLRDSPVRVVTCRQSGVGDTGDDVRASLDRWLARWHNHGIPMCGCNRRQCTASCWIIWLGWVDRYTWWCSARATRSMWSNLWERRATPCCRRPAAPCWSSVSSICDCAAG